MDLTPLDKEFLEASARVFEAKRRVQEAERAYRWSIVRLIGSLCAFVFMSFGFVMLILMVYMVGTTH